MSFKEKAQVVGFAILFIVVIMILIAEWYIMVGVAFVIAAIVLSYVYVKFRRFWNEG